MPILTSPRTSQALCRFRSRTFRVSFPTFHAGNRSSRTARDRPKNQAPVRRSSSGAAEWTLRRSWAVSPRGKPPVNPCIGTTSHESATPKTGRHRRTLASILSLWVFQLLLLELRGRFGSNESGRPEALIGTGRRARPWPSIRLEFALARWTMNDDSAVREHVSRRLYWEDAHVSFDKAVEGI